MVDSDRTFDVVAGAGVVVVVVAGVVDDDDDVVVVVDVVAVDAFDEMPLLFSFFAS